MPVALVFAHAQMLPRLEAEEALRAASVVAYGGGNMKEADAKAYVRRLQEQAGLAAPRRRATNADIRQIFGGGNA